MNTARNQPLPDFSTRRAGANASPRCRNSGFQGITVARRRFRNPGPERRSPRQRGAVLIIVLWIAFGLVSITLYFGHAMVLDLRSSDHLAAGMEAGQAIDGAARYVRFVLGNVYEPGQIPDLNNYEREEVPIGESLFWIIGREQNLNDPIYPVFGLIDEGSKLNINTATLEMLEALPYMTPDLAAAIIDWRTSDDETTPGGAGSETYLRHNPPYVCKNAPFETIEELRLVWGMDLEMLYGRDRNRNGVIDAEEMASRRVSFVTGAAGAAGFGLLEHVTVYSREPNRRSDGSARLNLNEASSQEMNAILTELFESARAQDLIQRLGTGPQNYQSVLDLFYTLQLEVEEFALLSDAVTVRDDDYVEGLVNINTARVDVLACLPGVGLENAERLAAYRQSNPDQLASIAWITQVLEPANARQAAPHITTRSFQFTADVAAVGRYGRGYRRNLFVFDTSSGEPRIVYRLDLGHLGWALGPDTRQRLARETNF